MRSFIHRARTKLRLTLFPTEFDRECARWVRDRGDERLRVEYPLSHESLVLDLGGYKGQWAADIFSRYLCRVVIFEPVAEFFKFIDDRFKHNNKITVFQCALGATSRSETIFLGNDGTSMFRKSALSETIVVKDAYSFFRENAIKHVDLMKVNIEGAEYELLEHIIDKGLVTQIKNIQVQFHVISASSKARMEEIGRKLALTHRKTYGYTFVWENWKLHD